MKYFNAISVMFFKHCSMYIVYKHVDGPLSANTDTVIDKLCILFCPYSVFKWKNNEQIMSVISQKVTQYAV